jgi:GGDEF domain-containing protein
VAFIMGGVKVLPGALPTVAAAAIMWVLVAEVPAWLIAQLEKQSALLRKIAQTDALTQLLDRSTLGPQLSRHASASAVVLIDLDHFKRYNDCHGHEAGDQLLVAFADALRWSVRKGDVIFRIGGDEFLLLLVGAGRTDAEEVLDRLRQHRAEVGGSVSFSAGSRPGNRTWCARRTSTCTPTNAPAACPPTNPGVRLRRLRAANYPKRPRNS